MDSFRDEEYNLLNDLYAQTEGLLTSEELVTTLLQPFAKSKEAESSSSNESARYESSIPGINEKQLERTLLRKSEKETAVTLNEQYLPQISSDTQISMNNRNYGLSDANNCFIPELNARETNERSFVSVNKSVLKYGDEFSLQCANNIQTVNSESISIREVDDAPDSKNTLATDIASTFQPNNISSVFASDGEAGELPTVFERSCSITDLSAPQKFRVIRRRVFNNVACLRGCKWSPDANYLLCNASDNILRVFSGSHLLRNFAAIDGGGITYDYDWYPSSEPYALRASSLGPVHLWDVSNRRVIGSYSTFDATDEVICAMTCVSSPDGEVLYCGAEKMISIFDTNRPGRDCQILSTKKHCQRGIVSTIAVNPVKLSLIAFGTYNKFVAFYDKRTPLCVFEGHKKGVTCVKFSPDGLVLYSGVRGSGEIFAWDLRKPGEVIFKMERVVRTQQRIYFDLSPDGRFLFSGSTDGVVRIWDTESGNAVRDNNNVLNCAEQFTASADCANGVSLHPNCEILATTSGQYDREPDSNAAMKDVSLKLWLLSDTDETAR